MVIPWVRHVEEVNRRRQVVWAAWEGVVGEDSFPEALVCLNEVAGVHKPHKDALYLPHDFIGLRWGEALFLVEQE